MQSRLLFFEVYPPKMFMLKVWLINSECDLT